MLSATPMANLATGVPNGQLEAPEQVAAVDNVTLDAGGDSQLADEFRLTDRPADSEQRQLDEVQQVARLELVFIDTTAEDYQQLVDDLLANADPDRELEAYLLDASRDGVEQISEILAGYDDVDAVHLVSHGREGQVNLGNTWLSMDNLDGYAGEIAGWNDSLRDGADLLIYGCDLAANTDGQALTDALGALCDCDVAASIDETGHAALGGDSTLR